MAIPRDLHLLPLLLPLSESGQAFRADPRKGKNPSVIPNRITGRIHPIPNSPDNDTLSSLPCFPQENNGGIRQGTRDMVEDMSPGPGEILTREC